MLNCSVPDAPEQYFYKFRAFPDFFIFEHNRQHVVNVTLKVRFDEIYALKPIFARYHHSARIWGEKVTLLFPVSKIYRH